MTPSSLNVSWEAVQTVKKGEPIEYLLQSQCVGKDPDFVQVSLNLPHCRTNVFYLSGRSYEWRWVFTYFSFSGVPGAQYKIRVQFAPRFCWGSISSLRTTFNECSEPVPRLHQRCLLRGFFREDYDTEEEEDFGKQRRKWWSQTGNQRGDQGSSNWYAMGYDFLLGVFVAGDHSNPSAAFSFGVSD